MTHTCSNLVLTCMDFRFTKTHNKWINSLGKECDRIALAGASKSIVDEDTRETALKQIKLANKLHGVTDVYLVDHEDCGAYGGKAAAGSDESEIDLHRENGNKAREIITNAIDGVTVYTKIAMLNGSVQDL